MNELIHPFFLLFVSFYVVSFIFVVNMDDWFLVWLGLEINMLSFILIMYSRESMVSVESCLKYFFIQSLGSVLMMSLFYLNEINYMYWGSLVLSYKMGSGPFFYWFPVICVGVDWISCLVLMSFQKIIPLVLITFFMSWVLWMVILLSLIVGVLGSFNQVVMSKLLAFSSIHHMGWMILCIILSEEMWFMYLLMYFIVIFPVIMNLWVNKIESMEGLMSLKFKLVFIMLILSMGGMPPFMGFFLKWISFYYILGMNYFFVCFMILMSVSMMYVYMRLIYKMLMGLNMKMGWVIELSYENFKVDMNMLVIMGLMIGVVIGGVMFM